MKTVKEKNEQQSVQVKDAEEMQEVQSKNIEVKEEQKPFNPLSKGRVIVRYILKKRGLAEKGNPYYGNRAPKGKDVFILPQRENGTFVRVLSDEEERFYEKALGLKEGDLNVNKPLNENFWVSRSNNDQASVLLSGKEDTYFDKSNPQDMIKLAILRAYPDIIASSPAERAERPRETYKWVIIDEAAQYADDESLTTKLMECNKILTKYYQDKWVLKYIIDKVLKAPTSPRTTLTAFQGKMGEILTTKLKDAYKVMMDKQLMIKANLAKARAFSIVNLRNGVMIYNNSPLAFPGMEATEQNAADYLSDYKNQELYLEILSKLPNDI